MPSSEACVTQKSYLADLDALKALADALPNTRMMALAKVTALVMLNMRYERLMLDRDLATHPYQLVSGLINDAQALLAGCREIAGIEARGAAVLRRDAQPVETHHHALFQRLWVMYSPEEYERRIERYARRLAVNGLGSERIGGRRCVDVGCGHGAFAQALLRAGAASVCGIDVGEDAIAYALEARDRLGVPASRLEFRVESAYRIAAPDASFDWAVQNGVFHHLDDEDAAIRELYRVLKPGGWLWYYTDGSGGISYDLWDASVWILRHVPREVILSHLEHLNIDTDKRYHLGDGLQAVYRHTTWDEMTGRLARLGFGSIERLVGGFPTDFDHDVIAADRYGREKFGEGDLRLLAQKAPG
jgi:ubiquinone/menaquinone biosynthesis C-methylase UbiE